MSGSSSGSARCEPGGHRRAATARSGATGTSRSAISLSAREIEHARDLVDVLRRDVEALHQQHARRMGHRAFDLQPDHLAEAPLAQLFLDRHEQVGRLFLLDREVGVARDPEEVVLQHLHAREQRVQVRGDDLLEQDVRPLADLHEARQHRRDLDSREEAFAALGVANGDCQGQRKVADVRERVTRVHGQRRQDGEYLVEEAAPQLDVALRVAPRSGRCGCPRRRAPRGPGRRSRSAWRRSAATAFGLRRGSMPRSSRPASDWSDLPRPVASARRREPGRTRRGCWRRWPGSALDRAAGCARRPPRTARDR